MIALMLVALLLQDAVPTEKEGEIAARKLKEDAAKSSIDGKIAAIHEAAKTEHEKVIKVIGEMMLTEADPVRIAGANSLEKLDHPASAEMLINAISPNLKREDVMPAIFKAIGELGWQSAAAPLNELLKKVAEPEIRTILPPTIQALGQLGSLTSVDPLIDLLQKLENGGRRNPWPNEGPIKNSAETALREITGMNLRGVAQWESWWKENQEASRARATRTYWVRKTQDRVEVGPTEKTPAESLLVASRIHTATGPGATAKKKKKGK
jgi:HEAT repeat protein